MKFREEKGHVRECTSYGRMGSMPRRDVQSGRTHASIHTCLQQCHVPLSAMPYITCLSPIGTKADSVVQ